MLSIVAKITRKDIAEGIRADCFHCPLACAVTRALPRYTGLFAVTGGLVVYAPPTITTMQPVKAWIKVCVLSKEAQEWVANFDFGQFGIGRVVDPVELPLNFYLPAPLPQTEGGK